MFEKVKHKRSERKLEKEKKALRMKELEKQRIEIEKQKIEKEEERLRNLDSKEVQVELIKAMRGFYRQFEELQEITNELEQEIQTLKINISFLEDKVNDIEGNNY